MIKNLQSMDMTEYPAKIARPFNQLQSSSDPKAIHKSLLDLAEGLLDYLIAFIFGEYKQSSFISEKLEAEFYKNTSRQVSAGVKVGFLRLLSTQFNNSVLSKKINVKNKYLSAGDFALTFDLLKIIIDDGHDSGFSKQLEKLRKGRSRKQIGINEFYDNFIRVRNIYAHPENKAGGKKSPRDWPLNNDFFNIINPVLRSSLFEIIDDLSVIKSFRPILIEDIHPVEKKVDAKMEVGEKEVAVTISLSKDILKEIVSQERYLLDEKDKIFAQLFLNAIPPLDPQVAEKIIRSEKSKIEEPRLVKTIIGMLDDKTIDHMEYFVLKDTATRAFISEDRLKELITKAKNKLGIPGTLDDILVESKPFDDHPRFNPWWLNYFALLEVTDRNKASKQNADIKNFDFQIDALEKKKEKLFVNRGIESRKNKILELSSKHKIKLKKIKNNFKEQLGNISSKIKDVREKNKLKLEEVDRIIKELQLMAEGNMSQTEKTKDKIKNLNQKKRDIQSTSKEKLNNLNEKKLEISEKVDARQNQEIEKIQHFISLIEGEITEIENNNLPKQQQLSEDIDAKIMRLRIVKESQNAKRQWSVHRQVWGEVTNYLQYIAGRLLNTSSNEDGTNIDGWVIDPNKWQIGALSHYYWGRLYQKESTLGRAIHVMLIIGGGGKTGPTKWNPEENSRLRDSWIAPGFHLHFGFDDKLIESFDLDKSIRKKSLELIMKLRNNNLEEFMNLDAIFFKEGGMHYLKEFDSTDTFFCLQQEELLNIKADDFDAISWIYTTISAPPWTLKSLQQDGVFSPLLVHKMENEIKVYIKLFSNILEEINDYALTIGLNKQQIKKNIDQTHRFKDVLYEEVEKYHIDGSVVLGEEGNQHINELCEEYGIEQRLLKSFLLGVYSKLKNKN